MTITIVTNPKPLNILPDGHGQLGRSDTVLLNGAFPEGTIEFAGPQLSNVHLYWSNLYAANMSVASFKIAARIGIVDRKMISGGFVESPSVGYYSLRYGANTRAGFGAPDQSAESGTPDSVTYGLGGGWPATPYLPNTQSPRGGSNYTDLPHVSDDLEFHTFQPHNSYGVGTNVNVSDSCLQQSVNSLNKEILLGKSPYSILYAGADNTGHSPSGGGA